MRHSTHSVTRKQKYTYVVCTEPILAIVKLTSCLEYTKNCQDEPLIFKNKLVQLLGLKSF